MRQRSRVSNTARPRRSAAAARARRCFTHSMWTTTEIGGLRLCIKPPGIRPHSARCCNCFALRPAFLPASAAFERVSTRRLLPETAWTAVYSASHQAHRTGSHAEESGNTSGNSNSTATWQGLAPATRPPIRDRHIRHATTLKMSGFSLRTGSLEISYGRVMWH